MRYGRYCESFHHKGKRTMINEQDKTELKQLLYEFQNALQESYRNALDNNPVQTYIFTDKSLKLWGQIKDKCGFVVSPGMVSIDERI